MLTTPIYIADAGVTVGSAALCVLNAEVDDAEDVVDEAVVVAGAVDVVAGALVSSLLPYFAARPPPKPPPRPPTTSSPPIKSITQRLCHHFRGCARGSVGNGNSGGSCNISFSAYLS